MLSKERMNKKIKTTLICAVAVMLFASSSIYAASILTIDAGYPWANNIVDSLGGHTVTNVTAAQIATVDFTLFDILYVTDAYSNSSTPAWASALNARQGDIDAFISAGGKVVAGVQAFGGDSTTNGDEYNFLPAGLVDGQTPGTKVYGNSVKITAIGNPLFDGLTDADLSGWGSSYHGSLTGSLPALATNNAGDVLIRGGAYGSGVVFVWTLDPDFHTPAGGYTLVENALNAVPEPATMALLGLGGLVLRRRKK